MRHKSTIGTSFISLLFLFALIQNLYFKEYEIFWCIKLKGILVALILIPVLFYTYNGIFGKSPDWINIAIFFISTGSSFLLEWYLFKKDQTNCRHPGISFGLIFLIGVFFVIFTFSPPQIPLFQDPLTGSYGL